MTWESEDGAYYEQFKACFALSFSCWLAERAICKINLQCATAAIGAARHHRRADARCSATPTPIADGTKCPSGISPAPGADNLSRQPIYYLPLSAFHMDIQTVPSGDFYHF